jgi:type II secretory pathway pseudopilin PulG
MKLFNSKYKQNIERGFTYIESILSITLTLVAAGAITFGISKGVRTYKSIQLKESALKALINYTEEYRQMIAYGEKPLSGKQPRNGHKIFIYEPKEERADQFDWGGSFDRGIEGTLFHIITDKSSETAGEQSGYYNIKTWIEWEDRFVGYEDEGFGNRKHLAFEVNQAVLTK